MDIKRSLKRRRPTRRMRVMAAARAQATLLYNRGRGDQTVTVIKVARFENIAENGNNQYTFFAAQQTVKVKNFLQTSPYAGLANVYLQARLNSYTVRAWIPNTSMSTTGVTAFKLYGDVRDVVVNPFYEGLLQERDHKEGRAYTVFQASWKPIEPSDYEFHPISTNILDSGLYGQINMAANALPEINVPGGGLQYTPIYEIKMQIEFKSLANPVPPQVSSPIVEQPSQLKDVPSGWSLFGR